MEFNPSNYNKNLKNSYDLVASKTWLNDDFRDDLIATSRSLFQSQSLKNRSPVPKNLEVYALLSGIQFPAYVLSALQDIQIKLSSILKQSLHYLVLPENLGLEYLVFKWPDDSWNQSRKKHIKNILEQMEFTSFKYIIYGIQINPDGCIIARGYDDGKIGSIRNALKRRVNFLPEKQSQWAHIPLGRILEPIGTQKFNLLKEFITKYQDKFILECNINSAKYVHESKWYMEKKEILLEINFD